MKDIIGYLAGEKQPEETTQCPKCKQYFYDYDWQQHDCESNRVELPVILQAERDERIRRLQAGYTGVNVEKAHCQICNKEHTIWVNYNQRGVCIINECRNNQEIFGKWLEKP